MLTKNLYSIEFKSDEKAIIKLADNTHPVFLAHFPTQPVLPGFINFEIVSEVFDIKINNIKKAKFNKILEPNQIVVYKRNGNSFKVFRDDEIVASFAL